MLSYWLLRPSRIVIVLLLFWMMILNGLQTFQVMVIHDPK